jgi:outer membrane protein with beta-barrel domain
MKKILLAILLITSTSLQSQVLISLLFGEKLNNPGVEFGLEGGLNFSKISNFESNRMLGTFGLGFYFDIRLKNQFYLNTGVLVKSTFGINKLSEKDRVLLNAEYYGNDGDYSLRLSYFMVPILIRYKLKNHFYIEAGPQAGLMYKSYLEYSYKGDSREDRIRNFNRDDINKIDVGAMGGVGYTLRKGTGMTLGIKYYYGFVDVVTNISGTKNSSFFIKINIPIGREKPAKESKEQK